MTPGIKPLIAGNWKMNGLAAHLSELEAIREGFDAAYRGRMDSLVCVPFTLLAKAAEAGQGSGVMAGAQDCHWNASGAHTGDISAEMIADCGAGAIIVGHSERRADHGETSETVRQKA